MNTSTWARWLIHAILMLMAAVLGLTSACGDLLDDVAQDATITDDDNDPCIAYDAETCQAHKECFAWWGGAVGEEGECGTEKFIGCELLTDRGCNQAITFAQDPHGACWVFGNSCIPPGFTDAGGGNSTCGWETLEHQDCQGEE